MKRAGKIARGTCLAGEQIGEDGRCVTGSDELLFVILPSSSLFFVQNSVNSTLIIH